LPELLLLLFFLLLFWDAITDSFPMFFSELLQDSCHWVFGTRFALFERKPATRAEVWVGSPQMLDICPTAKREEISMASSRRRGSSKEKGNGNHTPQGLWQGSLSFGLVNIYVRLVSAREKQDIHFSMIDPDNMSPIGYKYYNKASGEEVSRSKTVKAFEIKPGKFVVLTDADFKKANPKATQTIDIDNFVRLGEIDPVFFEKAYYLLPAKGSEKAYRLLCDALKKSGKVAIAKIVLHTKQHLVAIMPRGDHLLLELLHFADEVKELRELGDWRSENAPVKTSGREVEMAERLINDMTMAWNPDAYKDTYREDIMKRIKAKAKAGKATELTEDGETSKEAHSSKVVDLMPLLKKSLESKSKKAPARSRAAH
jgi:DNA end-binding protein Ku